MSDHHYTECGLQNVIIRGLDAHPDDDGDEVITIPFVNALHREIARGVVMHEKGMSGAELRFLRTEMGYTQSELAVLVHRDKQTVGRWERAETEIDSASETLIRALANEKLALGLGEGIEGFSRRSVPTAEMQTISIRSEAEGYSLEAA
jgi:DNA-binding transcriptional regulator YiaG